MAFEAANVEGVNSPSTTLRMSGKDALDILHRIGSQNVADLEAGQARATLFCDFRGRLLHRAWVARSADGSIWLLRDDAPGSDLAAHVGKHVFREDVKLEDLSGTHRVSAVAYQAWPDPHGLENRAGAVHWEGDVPAAVVDAHGFVLLVSPPSDPAAPDADFERARIRAGRPRHGQEIVDRFNPYEIGLAPDVHLSKGCYTGQEALQRLITFESVKRQLAVVSGTGTAPSPGDELRVGEREAAIVTSSVADGALWLGLAAVRRDQIEAPLRLDDARPVSVAPLDAGRPLGRP